MGEPSKQSWFLRKHEDGSIFGPLSFDQLTLWASTAQIAPHDAVSIDQQTWLKAPMLPRVKMSQTWPTSPSRPASRFDCKSASAISNRVYAKNAARSWKPSSVARNWNVNTKNFCPTARFPFRFPPARQSLALPMPIPIRGRHRAFLGGFQANFVRRAAHIFRRARAIHRAGRVR